MFQVSCSATRRSAPSGMTENEAIEEFGRTNTKVYRSQFVNMYYAPLEHKSPTLVKLVTVGKNEKVVGCHMAGDFADEMIQGFSVAVKMGATKRDFDNTVAIHPTAAEELVYVDLIVTGQRHVVESPGAPREQLLRGRPVQYRLNSSIFPSLSKLNTS